jgi:Flp pilus assembly pilin Flp
MERRGSTTRRARTRSLLRDRRGAIATEYVVLLALVACVALSGLIVWGPALVVNYEKSQGTLLSPFP